MQEKDIIQYISRYQEKNNALPSFKNFCDDNNITKEDLQQDFCWDSLLIKIGLKHKKSTKRNDEQLLLWLKTHPKTKYDNIPNGIRRALELRFGSVTEARKKAGLKVTDLRHIIKRKRLVKATGRPLEFTKELIIDGLQALASNLGKPPRIKDISKKNCGFPLSAIICRFGSFNAALQAASLPPVFSHHEFKKIEDELNTLLLNIKLNTDPPLYYKFNDGYKVINFYYEDRLEFVKLTRSDIQKNIDKFTGDKPTNIYYLVDDSLFETDKFKLINVMDTIESITDSYLRQSLSELRNKYDEINRKYIGQPF